jgi:hypothetical protein
MKVPMVVLKEICKAILVYTGEILCMDIQYYEVSLKHCGDHTCINDV